MPTKQHTNLPAPPQPPPPPPPHQQQQPTNHLPCPPTHPPARLPARKPTHAGKSNERSSPPPPLWPRALLIPLPPSKPGPTRPGQGGPTRPDPWRPARRYYNNYDDGWVDTRPAFNDTATWAYLRNNNYDDGWLDSRPAFINKPTWTLDAEASPRLREEVGAPSDVRLIIC